MRWIIGDIHGMLAPLEGLLRAIDRRDSSPSLIFVGDYINRGPDSKGVLNLLLTLKNARFVRGNHDDIFDHVLHALSHTGRPGQEHRLVAFSWFMQHGLDATLRSYGITDSEMSRFLRRPSPNSLNDLLQDIPPDHKRFLRTLPVFIEDDDLFVMHAKRELDDARPLTGRDSLGETALWGRYSPEDLAAPKSWDRVGYFGHTPVDRYTDTPPFLPILAERMILLDTAVALHDAGRLTAWCHEEKTFLQSDRAGRPVVGL